MTDAAVITVPGEFVAYHPPKSASHGHGSRARNARRAWAATEEFISKHTNATLSPTLRVTVWGPSEWTDAAVYEKAIDEGTLAFGASPTVSGIFSVWELPIARLPQALEFAFKDEERPKQQLGPVGLSFWYSLSGSRFRLFLGVLEALISLGVVIWVFPLARENASFNPRSCSRSPPIPRT